MPAIIPDTGRFPERLEQIGADPPSHRPRMEASPPPAWESVVTITTRVFGVSQWAVGGRTYYRWNKPRSAREVGG